MTMFSLRRLRRPYLVFSLLALISIEGVALAQKVREEMTDRCSGDVIIVPKWDAPMNTAGSIYLKRGKDGKTPMSEAMSVDDRRIRWYCKSNSPFAALDPGTWRINGSTVTQLILNPSGVLAGGSPTQPITVNTSAQDGWYPERSRCAAGTTKIRAYLGPNRLLRINCY